MSLTTRLAAVRSPATPPGSHGETLRNSPMDLQPLRALTARQTVFVNQYLSHGNGARAVREAGYSPKSANSRAAQLLRKPRIQKLIRQEEARALSAAELSHDQWVRQTSAIAFHDPRSLFRKNGERKELSEMSADERAALSIKQEDVVSYQPGKGLTLTRRIRIRALNKLTALDALCRYLSPIVHRTSSRQRLNDYLNALHQTKDRFASEEEFENAMSGIPSRSFQRLCGACVPKQLCSEAPGEVEHRGRPGSQGRDNHALGRSRGCDDRHRSASTTRDWAFRRDRHGRFPDSKPRCCPAALCGPRCECLLYRCPYQRQW